MERTPVEIVIPPAGLGGNYARAVSGAGIVVFVHGSGSSRFSPRHQFVADALRANGLGTLLFDLLREDEAADRRKVFNIPLLASRLADALDWLGSPEGAGRMVPVGLFGASTGTAAALVAAAADPRRVQAVVLRGGRPDLAEGALAGVRAPTLLIVGSLDTEVLALNLEAKERLGGPAEVRVVQGAAIRTREISPIEAVQAALARVEAGRSLNAFITVTNEMALNAAREAEAAVMRGDALPPLHGVPYSVKDLTATQGVRTTMGSAIFADNVPKQDAVSVARAKRAGAILIGKTTTPEFGHKQLTQAPIFGLTLNPIDRSVTCGASSGGAAVAVATGMGPLALGTDGGGSIRIPAACCGVVGLKATLGAVPHLQVPDLFAANSFTGPMARGVAMWR